MEWNLRLAICAAVTLAGCRQILGLRDLGADARARVDAPVDASVDAPADAPVTASCRELPQSSPSGMYVLDPDGPGGDAPFSAFCDMMTAGGGWTLVFVPTSSNYNTEKLDYTAYTTTLLAPATEALIANRKADLTVMGTAASFPLPDDWKGAAPFTATGTDVNLLVTLWGPGAGPPATQMLRYGFSDWSTDCAGAWEVGTGWGRICVPGTTAPFFNGFDAPDMDDCVQSSDTYNAMFCSPGHMFTIGVR